ncbi:MAG: type I methionyl aminopeptidase [Chloroflexi bacterium]|nr:type I methionyl aminopeptidase [Chloroflexota bacterium]
MTARRPASPARIALRSREELAAIRAAARVVARTIAELREAVRPGIRTRDLEHLAAESFRRQGARSGTLGYFGYPGQLCISVNDEVVHGIPGERRLAEGDLVKLDVVAVKDGFYGDAAVSVPVGEVRPEVARLVRVTEEALWAGIAQARPGNHIGDIGHAIERHVAAHGLVVVRDFVGHGIGRAMHEPPQVPNFGEPGTGPLLRPGMVLAIEPQVNLGTAAVRILDDGWTAVTADGAWSAHFEHTVAITEAGPEVLTLDA